MAGPLGRPIQSAELEKLAMVVEAAKISGVGNGRQCIDRPDAGDLPQELIILAVPKQFVGLCLNLVPLSDQAVSTAEQNQATEAE
ncbi:hypothetical protein GGQ85_004532 [Nitrobacter vulgaris]|nr:hypothetical protein [Nitrobacter vulgaris]